MKRYQEYSAVLFGILLILIGALIGATISSDSVSEGDFVLVQRFYNATIAQDTTTKIYYNVDRDGRMTPLYNTDGSFKID